MRFDTDPYLERYAARVGGMRASEIRALFSVVSRPEVVSFAGGMPATSALDLAAVEEVTGRVIRERGADALQYGSGQGLESLREQMVGIMAHEGVPAHVDDLVVTVGGQQAIELVTKCFVDPGDVVVAEGPTYVGALGAFQSHQAAVAHVPMDDHGMQVELLDETLDRVEAEGRRAKFVYTVPNHQNPAGVSLSVDRRHQLAEVVERRDLVVLEDNPYGLLDFDGKTWVSLRELIPDRVVYVGTMSKTFAPGARIGWVAAPPPVRDKLVLLREAADLCPPNLAQMIVETWLGTQPWQAQVRRFRDVYREKATVMLSALADELPAGVSWTRPVGGFYVWVTLPPGIDTSDLLAKAIDHRVAFVPGRGFYGDGQGGDQLRLCFSYPEPDRIHEGIVRFGELLHDELQLVRAVYGDEVPPARGRGGADPVAGQGG